MRRAFSTCAIIACCIVAFLATPAWADIAARYEMNDDDAIMQMEMTIEADEHGNVRTQMAKLGSYYLLLEGEFYQVSGTESGQVVVRVSDMMELQAELAKDFFRNVPEGFEVPKEMFAAMETETVGGREGIDGEHDAGDECRDAGNHGAGRTFENDALGID